MVAIPKVLIERNDLTVLQRAILPLLIHHTFGWGTRDKGVAAKTLSDILGVHVKELIEALDALCEKNILHTVRQREGVNTHILYAISNDFIENVNNPASATPAITQALRQEYHDAGYYLNLPKEDFDALHAFALSQLDQNALPSDVFDDFNLYQRSKNRRSFDWRAEFLRWMNNEKAKRAPSKALMLDEHKPTGDQFALAEYFISKLQAIDPQFEAPFDVMSWGKQIKLLEEIDNYTPLDIKSAVDWLFSSKGDWFRPNVPDAWALRKHFKRIISHTRSYRDAKAKLPSHVNIFDLLEED